MVSEKETIQYRSYWERAYEDFHERLNAYARRLSRGNVHDAEDLVQEAICRAIMYPRDPKKIRNPVSYLLRTVRNIWTDKWAKENTANLESLDVLQSTAHHPSVEPVILRILENEEIQKQITANRGPLTSREKILLTFHLSGYTSKDIATVLDEDVRLTRADLNAVKTKVRYRLMKANLRR